MKNYLVLLSGGAGRRLKGVDIPKQYILVKDKPVIIYTLERIEGLDEVEQIVIVAHAEWRDQIRKWIKEFSISKPFVFADPGDDRQTSILHGLEKCMEMSDSEDDIVVIHDAVRPMTEHSLFLACINGVEDHVGCMSSYASLSTMYFSNSGTKVDNIINRDLLYVGQTPEAYRLREYYKINAEATDEERQMTRGSSEIAFRHGMTIKLIEADEINFKITTMKDLKRFEQNIWAQGANW